MHLPKLRPAPFATARHNVGTWTARARRVDVILWTEAEFAALPYQPRTAKHYPAGVWVDVHFG